MKIVLVTPLLDHGGGQKYVSELANYWAKLNYSVTIILLRSGESFYTISSKVKIYELGYLHKTRNSKLIKIVSGILTYFKLRKCIKQINPDFVLSILSTTNILTILSTRYLGIRVYVNDIMSPFRKRPIIEKSLRKILYKKADGVIALTNIAKNMITKETNSKNIKVIPNPVSAWESSKNIDREKIIINVGRLHGTKGQKYFLKSCAQLKNSEWKFVILGEGPLRGDLKKQAHDLGITSQLEMPGAVKNVNDWLARASIFAFPSVSEGLPIALIEAMSVGLPCVSFDCETGPREIIEDGKNGFLVPVGNVEMFTLKLKQLMNNPELRDKFSINTKNIAEKYSIEKISKEILEFCTE